MSDRSLNTQFMLIHLSGMLSDSKVVQQLINSSVLLFSFVSTSIEELP